MAQHNNLHIHFSNNLLEFVDSHKHLGITFSANCKWTVHITVIIASASRQLNMLRKLKFRLDRFILNRLYLTYIRPVLEYASEVWDGCSVTDANRLEQIQLNAARIVTGLPIFATKESLYYETGWETLAERRKTQTFTLNVQYYKRVSSVLLNKLSSSVSR